jgi:hypothetical protein
LLQVQSVDKLMQKRVYKTSVLTNLFGNKTTDTKHLKDLLEAKRLISSTKKQATIKDINRIISAFKTSYDAKY